MQFAAFVLLGGEHKHALVYSACAACGVQMQSVSQASQESSDGTAGSKVLLSPCMISTPYQVLARSAAAGILHGDLHQRMQRRWPLMSLVPACSEASLFAPWFYRAECCTLRLSHTGVSKIHDLGIRHCSGADRNNYARWFAPQIVMHTLHEQVLLSYV